MLEGDTILEWKFPRNPKLDGAFEVPSVRPRPGLPSVDPICDLKGFVKSWLGSVLDPGLLSDSLEDGLELSDLRLDPGRDTRLAGLEACLEADRYGSVSKKLECEPLLLREGDDGRRERVSTVLSANDGRGSKLLRRMISSPGPSSPIGLAWDRVSSESALDILVRLVLPPLGNADCDGSICCEDALFLRPGSREACDSFGESYSGRVAIRSRGGGRRDSPW